MFGDDGFRSTADEIFRYVLRDMTSPEGAFYSAEDADSEGEEGLFYLWRKKELAAILGDEDGAFAAELWSAQPGGNFLDEATRRKNGRNILHLTEPLARRARRGGLTEGELADRVERVRATLFEVREDRIHPLKDDKVLTDWKRADDRGVGAGGARVRDRRVRRRGGSGCRLRVGRAARRGRSPIQALSQWPGRVRWAARGLRISDLRPDRAVRDDVRRSLARRGPRASGEARCALLGRGARRLLHGARRRGRADRSGARRLRRRDSVRQLGRRVEPRPGSPDSPVASSSSSARGI